MKNTDVIFFNEYRNLLKRKEYTHYEVKKYMASLPKIDATKNCHQCGKKFNLFLAKLFKRGFCNFCMQYVCEKSCLHEEKFMIPRNCNISFDLS